MVSDIDKNIAKKNDLLGLRLLQVKDLRIELEVRGLTWICLLKPQQVATLTASIQSEHGVNSEQEDVRDALPPLVALPQSNTGAVDAL